MLIMTTEGLNSHNYKALGEVFGVTNQSRNAISDWSARVKNVVGGEVEGYTKMLHRSREEAIRRMQQDAEDLGGDAIVMMPFRFRIDWNGHAIGRSLWNCRKNYRLILIHCNCINYIVL